MYITCIYLLYCLFLLFICLYLDEEEEGNRKNRRRRQAFSLSLLSFITLYLLHSTLELVSPSLSIICLGCMHPIQTSNASSTYLPAWAPCYEGVGKLYYVYVCWHKPAWHPSNTGKREWWVVEFLVIIPRGRLADLNWEKATRTTWRRQAGV